jgi:hypothetical protein
MLFTTVASLALFAAAGKASPVAPEAGNSTISLERRGGSAMNGWENCGTSRSDPIKVTSQHMSWAWSPSYSALGPNWDDVIYTTMYFNVKEFLLIDSASARVQFTLKVPGLGNIVNQRRDGDDSLEKRDSNRVGRGYKATGADGQRVAPVFSDNDGCSAGDQDTITVTHGLCDLIRISQNIQNPSFPCLTYQSYLNTDYNIQWWFQMPYVSLSQIFSNYLESQKYSYKVINAVADAANKHQSVSLKIKVFQKDSQGSYSRGREISCIKKTAWIA